MNNGQLSGPKRIISCLDADDGADAALTASLLHFGKTTVWEIKKHVQAKGVCVKW